MSEHYRAHKELDTVKFRHILKSIARKARSLFAAVIKFIVTTTKRLLAFAYSTLLFQLYFVITLMVCGYSTERVWGKEGIIPTGKVPNEFIENGIWGYHYYWYFFSALLATIIGGLIFGLSTKNVTKLKIVLAFVPNAAFVAVVAWFVLKAYQLDVALLPETKPFFWVIFISLPVCYFLFYWSAWASAADISPFIYFNRAHFLWLTIPYLFYLSGFLLAFAIHLQFTWHDFKEAFLAEFDFSLKHFVKEFWNRLFPFFEMLVDLLIALALNVWKYPLAYTLKFLNGEFLTKLPKGKGRLQIGVMLILGLPLAGVVEVICYYLLSLIDSL